MSSQINQEVVWEFLPGHDIPGFDIGHYSGKSVEELMQIADRTTGCVSFNTNGWMKNTTVGAKICGGYERGGLFIKVVRTKASENLIKLMIESYSQFMDMFSTSQIDGIVLQKIGKDNKLILGRDDNILVYDKISVINYENQISVEEDLCKIFYKNFILTSSQVDPSEDFPNLVPRQIDEELVRSLSRRESLYQKKTPSKILFVVNTTVTQFEFERHLIKSLLDKSANISQLILNVHNICHGDEHYIEGLFSMLQYLTQDYVIISFQKNDQVKFGNINYPKHISVTYINRNMYDDRKISPALQFV